MNLYVSNLDFSTSSEDLQQLFAQFGEVSSAKVITDITTGKSRGFAFVEMASDEAGQQAIDQMNGKVIKGRNASVAIARDKGKRSDNKRW